jgi:DNA-binding LacI/PurR family transcriptional regulator
MSKNLQRDPLYTQIASVLRNEIMATARAGDRLDSERALAKRFDVSVLTVREALGSLVREGTIQRRRGSGTVVTDPSSGRHVGVLVDLDIAHRMTYFFRRVALKVQTDLESQGIPARLYTGRFAPGQPEQTDLTAFELLADLDRGRISTIVPIAAPGGPWMERVAAANVSLVPDPRSPVSLVHVDYGDLVRKGVRALLAKGRRNIALLGYGALQGPEAISAFDDELRAAGLSSNPKWVRFDQDPKNQGAGWEDFLEVWSASRDAKPDGLIVCDDILFDDVAKAILSLRVQVPDQLMIVSHANKGSPLRVPFTILKWEVDPDEYAAALVRMTVEHLRDKGSVPTGVRIVGQLNEHTSRFSERLRQFQQAEHASKT